LDADIPKQIGRYEVDRLVGAGAMGFVFLGRDPELDRAVAIKTLRDLAMDADALATFVERFRNEARAAARLHHPSIVQVYDVGVDDESGPFVVFEYVPGSSLKQIIRSRGGLAPAKVLRLAEQVGDALDLAHREEIIHRDIKPDNILVTDDGRTKLADFGVARVPDAALTREGQFLGTPCYAAPETLAEGDYGPHTDLFSFAAVLYEAVSGRRAFPGDDAVAVAHKVIHDEPPPAHEVAERADVPESIGAILKQGLSKRPEERYATASELAAALRAAYAAAGLAEAEGREPSTSVAIGGAPTVGARRAPAPDERRHGAWAFGAVLVGALAVGIAVVFAFSGAPTVEVEDVYDAGVGMLLVPDGGQSSSPSTRSDAAATQILDSEPDAGTRPDSGSAALTDHEREELAKDALDEAERLIRAGDLDAARASVQRAYHLDPGNSDIARVRALIRAAAVP
jgi:serine/threonine-protein kinase